MPKISLILPLYNAQMYLKPCLDSVQSQTFTDFECICIDDGCTDGTLNILKGYMDGDDRFRLIQQANAGCSEARNHGMREARAPYIMFLDQDDMLHPQAMELLLRTVEQDKTDVVAGQYKVIDDAYDITTTCCYNIDAIQTEQTQTPFKDFIAMKKGRQYVVWTRIYKREAIEGLTFPKDAQPTEDTTFTLKVMQRIQSLSTIKEPVLLYRDGNPTSVIAKKMSDRYITSCVNAARDIHAHFGALDITDDQKGFIKSFIANIIYKGCIFHIFKWGRVGQWDELISIARPLLQKLHEDGILDLSVLSPRKRVAAELMLAGRTGLLKIQHSAQMLIKLMK